LGNVNDITDSLPIAFASQREASEGVRFVVNGHCRQLGKMAKVELSMTVFILCR
jgi:hypothetical protein